MFLLKMADFFGDKNINTYLKHPELRSGFLKTDDMKKSEVRKKRKIKENKNKEPGCTGYYRPR